MNAWEWDRAHLFRFRAKLISVTDGDSIKCLLDLGCSARYEARIRIADLWAPERNEPGGAEAALTLMLAMETGVGDWPLRIVSRQRDTIISEVQSFARWVGDVYVCQADGELIDVREVMR